jgi:hypothetical protein
MIYKKLDNNGKVNAYVIYHQLERSGAFSSSGEYIYVEDVWLHEEMRKSNMVRILYEWLNDELHKMPDVKYLYWVRYKYGDRMSLYEIVRDKRIKLIKKEIKHGKQWKPRT